MTTGRGLSGNNSFYLASRPFATQHAGALTHLFAALSEADQLAQNRRSEAIKLVAEFSGLDAGVVSLFLQRRPPSPVKPLAADVVQDQQRVADAFQRLNLIPRRVQVADIVWRPQAHAQSSTPSSFSS